MLWRLNYAPGESKPSFHPVAPAGGPVLTGYRPADHRWHRGLWFSWKFINGVNYWEEDPKTGRSQGRTQWKEPRIETRPDFSARIELDLEYISTNGQPVLTEHRLIETFPPDAQGNWHCDWSLAFRAGDADLLLDRTPLPSEPDGKPYGGYAGLSVRLSGDLAEPKPITTEGPIEFVANRFRGRALGLDYSAKAGAREAGIAILDHPANLNSPSPWYAIHDKAFLFFSPAVLCYSPQKLKPHQTFTLRYRVVVHNGRLDEAELKREAQRFGLAPAK